MVCYQTIKTYLIALLFLAVGCGLITSCNGQETGEADRDTATESVEKQRTNEGQVADTTGQTFETTLEGSNEIPKVNTDAEGTVTVEVRGDSIYVTGKFSGLSSPYAASHIHKGGKDENGQPIITLEPTIDPNRTSGSFDGSYQLQQSQLSALKNDSLYVNVHTDKYQHGEIRGQITVSSDIDDE